MLGIIRWSVWVGTLVLLPVAARLAGYYLAPFSGFSLHERLFLQGVSFLGFLGAGAFETKIYFRELRSLVPRPLASAGTFILQLGLTLLISEAAFLGVYALLRGHGVLMVPLPFLAAFLAYGAPPGVLLTPREEFVRGRKYRSFREVFFLSKLEGLFTGEKRISFGGILLPWSSAVKHFLILGVTGAGKSMIMQLLMQVDAPRTNRAGRGRAGDHLRQQIRDRTPLGRTQNSLQVDPPF